MDDSRLYEKLPQALLPWYRENGRDLPWRKDREPYHVWVSEIMLQQTRVEAVKGYYTRFLAALPDINALANCDEDTLHKLWEGLGYYSRVRNLKKAAQAVLEHHGGGFPRAHSQVLALPGVGEYTAGAICSICYNQPTPAVDGNVLRVIARVMDDDTPIDLPVRKKAVQAALAAVYPAEAGDFTQALMELGATICGPNRKPDCEICPCRDFCRGHQKGTAESLPVKSPKKGRNEEEKTVLILRWDGRYALEKRPEKGLLAGLWQFPNVDGALSAGEALAVASRMDLRPREILRQLERKHIFTHIQWNMRGFYIDVDKPGADYQWFTPEQIDTQAALPTAFRQFWEEREHV